MATHRERSRLQRLLYSGQQHRRGVWSYELRHLVFHCLRALCWRHVDRATGSFIGDCPAGAMRRSPGLPDLSTTLREVERPPGGPGIRADERPTRFDRFIVYRSRATTAMGSVSTLPRAGTAARW